MSNGTYDIIIIDGGAGGGMLARHLAPSGKSILLLERGIRIYQNGKPVVNTSLEGAAKTGRGEQWACALAALGTLLERAPMRHGVRGLQSEWNCLGLPQS